MTSAPSTTQAYCDDLLLALRTREVPGSRIGEVLAEVQSHVAETGEDPRTAFGRPKEYADQVADALGLPRTSILGFLCRSLSWPDLLTAALLGLGCFALADGVWSLGAGEDGLFGRPAWVAALVGAAVVAVGVARTVQGIRRDRHQDAVIDPRTGADMVPFSGWRLVLLAAVPTVFILMMLVGGLLARS